MVICFYPKKYSLCLFAQSCPRPNLFLIGDWNAKVECQEKPGVTGISGLELKNEAGQRLTEF